MLGLQRTKMQKVAGSNPGDFLGKSKLIPRHGKKCPRVLPILISRLSTESARLAESDGIRD